MRPYYGVLNNLAHPSITDSLEKHVRGIDLPSGATGVSPLPLFNQETASEFYRIHNAICFGMTLEFLRLLIELHSTDDPSLKKIADQLCKFLQKLEGAVKNTA